MVGITWIEVQMIRMYNNTGLCKYAIYTCTMCYHVTQYCFIGVFISSQIIDWRSREFVALHLWIGWVHQNIGFLGDFCKANVTSNLWFGEGHFFFHLNTMLYQTLQYCGVIVASPHLLKMKYGIIILNILYDDGE